MAYHRAAFLLQYICVTVSNAFAETAPTSGVDVINVTSIVQVSDDVDDGRLHCYSERTGGWSSGPAGDVFNCSNTKLRCEEIRARGTFGITLAADKAVHRLAHALFVQGSEEAVRVVGVVVLTSQVPVIAIPPRHTWFREGHKLPNVLVPRFGQSLKGAAAVDIIKPPTGDRIERAAIWRESRASPELEAVLEAQKSAPGLHFQQFYLSPEGLSLGRSNNISSSDNSVEYDSFIVDSSLDLFEDLISLLPAETATSQLVVVFLHEFYEVVAWSGLSELASLSPYIFAFRQHIPANNRAISSNYSIYDAVRDDSLAAIAAAAANRRDVDLADHTYVPIKTGNGDTAFELVVLTDGAKFISNLKGTCLKGKSGHLGFTTGLGLSPDCLDGSWVSFDVMQLNVSSHLRHGHASCESSWDVVGNWSTSEGLQMEKQLWSLSIPVKALLRPLRILVVPFGPFAYLQNNATEWKGIDVELLSFIILHKDVGLNISEVYFTKWNGSRDSVIKDLTAENVYDIVIGGIPVRLGNIHYGRTYFTSSLGILQRTTEDNGRYLWRFLSPFNWTVWVSSLAVILVCGVVCKWLGLSDGYSQGLWLASCTVFFLQENRLVAMHNYWGRIFMISYSIFVLILTSTYTANLVSFLSPTPSRSAVSLTELVHVPVVTLASSPHLQLLRQSTALKRLTTASTIVEAVESLRNGSVDAFLADTALLLHIVNVLDDDCQLVVVGGGYFKQQFAFPLGQEFASSYGVAVNGAIQDAVGSGLVLNLFRQYVTTKINTYKCVNAQSPLDQSADDTGDDSSDETSLDYNNMGGIFIVLSIAAIVALIVRVLRLCWSKVPVQHKSVNVSNSDELLDPSVSPQNISEGLKKHVPSSSDV